MGTSIGVNGPKMIPQRIGLQGLRARPSRSLLSLRTPRSLRSITSTAQRFQDVFHAQTSDPSSSAILSSLKTPSRIPQTLTEKIVQRLWPPVHLAARSAGPDGTRSQ